MNELSILIVEDDQDLLEAICTTVKLSGYKALGASSGAAALDLLNSQQIGLVISDIQMQPIDGNILLKRIKETYPDIPVLLMTAYGEINKAIAAMRAGASDYLLKPFSPDYLLTYINNYLAYANNQYKNYDEIVAKDPRTNAMFSLAKRVAESSATVMLIGESGSGKEILARFIHQHSPRSEKPFVAINCAAIPENLLEATLFGYEKGAFTGAAQAQPGKFEQANEGTLLLDEISEMPLGLQAKLLRVLQEREVERIGGRKPVKLDIRLLTASNRDIFSLVKQGTFREDLYYRLNVFPLEIAPLRERPLDIEPLVYRILQSPSKRIKGRSYSLTKSALLALSQYPWPGNVRELENVIQRAMILATDEIDVIHLNLPEQARSNVKTIPDTSSPSQSKDIKSLEREHILKTLAEVNGSRKLAVQRLGISERTLRYKLQQYRLVG
ncbi:MAG: sigma-54-dependent Fis family transcriptional regulator [Nitrosomonas sp.]|nr:sigma-54-dependent Fis family transcriptional regulator [Nitrosomonas sp.]